MSKRRTSGSKLSKKISAKKNEIIESALEYLPTTPAEDRRVQREKHIALWSAVIFFMGVVVIVWIFNFKNNFKEIDNFLAKTETIDELKTIAQDISEVIHSTSEDLDEVRNIFEAEWQKQNSTRQVSAVEIATLRDRLELIDQRLKLEKFLASLNENLKKQSIIK